MIQETKVTSPRVTNSQEKNIIAPKPILFEQRSPNILKRTLKQTVLLIIYLSPQYQYVQNFHN